MPVLQEEHFSTAGSLIDALRPTNSRWLPNGAYRQPWVFRGHADAEWPLLPAAWRHGQPDIARLKDAVRALDPQARGVLVGQPQPWELEGQVDELVPDDRCFRALRSTGIGRETLADRIMDLALHVAAETLAVAEFERLADAVGHPLPRKQARLWPSVHARECATERTIVHETTPLAQHHGIPTCLLDWSRSPLSAAYFAVAAGADTGRRADALAVWALKPQPFPEPVESVYLQVVEYPHASSAFLHAQDGLFTVVCQGRLAHGVDDRSHFFLEHGRWPDVGQDVDGAFELRKMTLPWAEARELGRLLWIEGVSKAHLMPSYDSVTETLKTMWQLGGLVSL